MNETVAAYLEFLWEQFQYDWSWMSNPWGLYTIVPEIAYLFFFTIKWMILLAPITIPIVTWQWIKLQQRPCNCCNREDFINN